MNKSEQIIAKFNFKKTTINSYDNELSNDELHELLNDECVYFQVLMNQDTWSFSDGSYITRNVDDYYTGVDVADFELTAGLYADSELEKFACHD